MITDKEVVQTFQGMPITPIPFTEEEQKGRKLQIFRGVSGRLWKDAHPAGCLFRKFRGSNYAIR
jgi:hypothetical protein